MLNVPKYMCVCMCEESMTVTCQKILLVLGPERGHRKSEPDGTVQLQLRELKGRPSPMPLVNYNQASQPSWLSVQASQPSWLSVVKLTANLAVRMWCKFCTLAPIFSKYGIRM